MWEQVWSKIEPATEATKAKAGEITEATKAKAGEMWSKITTKPPSTASNIATNEAAKAAEPTPAAAAATAAPTKAIVCGWKQLDKDNDSSPACLKLETFLKMCKIDFDTKYFAEHQMKHGAPPGNKKVPWIHWDKVNNGQPLGDSTLVINTLVKSDPNTFDLDSHLTKEQRAVGTAFKTMLEESTYFTGVLQVRWVSKQQYDSVTMPTYFDFVPPLLRGIVAHQIRGKLLRDCQGHGTHNVLTEEKVLEKFQMELKAVSDYLGDDKPYFMGDKVTSFDATVFAYLAILEQGKWNHPANKAVRDCSNIMNYLDRMRKEFWPELQQQEDKKEEEAEKAEEKPKEDAAAS